MSDICLQENKIVVVGLGLTGISCARYLASRQKNFVLMDSRTQPPLLDEFKNNFPDQQCVLGGLDENILCNADAIIVSPGVALTEVAISKAIENGVDVKGDIDLFRAAISKPIVAITGSNGKTTVTTLVGEMAKSSGLRVAVAGNIGLPVLDLLDEQGKEREDVDLYVLELSSFQLERLAKLSADVAVVLNLSADHMDRYSDLQNYHQAKQRIFVGTKKAVVNRASQYSAPSLPLDQISYGLDRPESEQFGVIESNGRQHLALGSASLLAVDELKVFGSHNIENALAGLALGYVVGLPMEKMLGALKEFRGLAHRCQFVAHYKGIDFINDSKGTNVGATIAAVEGFCKSSDRNVVLIAGGDGKGADFSPLRDVVTQYVRAVVLIGQAARDIAAVLSSKTKTFFAESMSIAVLAAFNAAKPGDIILLSPACASFDMYRNYAERGEHFIAVVQELTATGGDL